MADHTTQWLYLGNQAEMDTDETDRDLESPSIPLGEYDINSMELADVTLHDEDDDGFLYTNNQGNDAEPVTYTTTDGTFSSDLDSVSKYSVLITFSDGSTTTKQLDVYQLEDGSVFASTDHALDDTNIESIELLHLNHGTANRIHLSQDNGFDNATITCFAAGTSIETPKGEVLIEDLCVGDLVCVSGSAAKPIRWIGAQTVRAKGVNAPVLIKKSAMGNHRDLLVSQQHRMLVSDWRAEVLFGKSEVLTAAINLVNDDNIRVTPMAEITYFHMLFDSHEIVFAQGIASESFHPSKSAIDNLSDQSREEVLRLFPQLEENGNTEIAVAHATISVEETGLLNSLM